MSVEQDLRAERVSQLDLSDFVPVQIGTRVVDVVRRMRETGACALVTGADGRLAGIFTERDVLRKVTRDPQVLERRIEALMTSDPDTVDPDQPVAAALELMNRGHYRHVPVVDGRGRIVGNLTHNAIIRFLCDRLPTVTYNLSPTPDQFARSPEGA